MMGVALRALDFLKICILGAVNARKGACIRLSALALLSSSSIAHAAATINFGDNESLSIGLGTRASVTFDNNGAPSGGSSTDFSLDSIRLYINGQLTKALGATLDTERDLIHPLIFHTIEKV